MSLQSKKEEALNAYSHGFGVILGIIGLFFLISKIDHSQPYYLLSVIVYGLSIIILFFASTLYHVLSKPVLKQKFRVADHISIYLLIAGTYTPVLLIVLPNSLGWQLLCAVWGIALFGVQMELIGCFQVVYFTL